MPKSKKKIESNKNKKSKKNSYDSYYLIHDNGGRPLIVTIKKKSLYVYETIYGNDSIFYDSNNKFIINKQKNYQEFIDYTSSNKEKIYISSKEIYKIPNFKKIFIGYDVQPNNTYIKNKKFGSGNSILVFDGKNYICIAFGGIIELDTPNIKGTPIGYISPIGNNDVPYPMMFTNTHIYSWCGNIEEYKIPLQGITNKIIKLLCKFKNPHEIPKKYVKDINNFCLQNQCGASKILLKQKRLF